MAWETQITVKSLARCELSVSATRTDDADPEDVRSYTLTSVVVDLDDLPGALTQVVNDLYAAYLADEARRAQVETLIGGWEDAVATALVAREVE